MNKLYEYFTLDPAPTISINSVKTGELEFITTMNLVALKEGMELARMDPQLYYLYLFLLKWDWEVWETSRGEYDLIFLRHPSDFYRKTITLKPK